MEIKSLAEIIEEKKEMSSVEGGEVVDPRQVPSSVAERLGYRCPPRCGFYSLPSDVTCPNCGQPKVTISAQGGHSVTCST